MLHCILIWVLGQPYPGFSITINFSNHRLRLTRTYWASCPWVCVSLILVEADCW